MSDKLMLVLKYLRYYIFSDNGRGHGVHSPFVFNFIKAVLNDSTEFESYNTIESTRKELLQNHNKIAVEDFGAGSRVSTDAFRTISSIAKNALKPKKYGQLLFRIVKYYQPKNIIELGTSLGITTSYLASGCPNAEVITMEGSVSVANLAKENFKKLSIQHIQLIEGNFDLTLPITLKNMSKPIDFAFLDGNHRYQPTINYFEQILSKCHNDSIIILDDIHWSNEMEAAWSFVKKHPQVRLTIDLFFIGIVLLKKEFLVKQDFIVRF